MYAHISMHIGGRENGGGEAPKVCGSASGTAPRCTSGSRGGGRGGN